MPHAELPGVRLWYTDSGGDGVPVVFLHAASGTSASFVRQWPAFTAAGFRCIAYDRRGWGRTLTTEGKAEDSEYVDDLRGLLDRLGLERVHLVGVAAGAAPVPDFALSFPQRVRSIVVADSQCSVEDAEYIAFKARVRPPEITALPVELRELSASYRGRNPEGVREWLAMEQMTRAEGYDGGGQYYVARQRHHNHVTFALLETMQVPALVLVGDADLVTPPAQMRMVAEHIRGCEFVVVPEAGHAAFWEQPDIWNRAVLDFIGRH